MNNLLPIILILASCSRHQGSTASDIQSEQAMRDAICRNEIVVPRCDNSTFQVLFAVACYKPIPTRFEFPAGKWNRDVTPCYPEESSSETSRDTYLSVIMSEDKEAIKRALDFQENGETGEPKGGVGNIAPLLPLMRMQTKLTESEDLPSVQKAMSGHRGHLIAGYLWARSRLRGGLGPMGVAIMKKISAETPESPYLSCLAHKFTDGDFDHVKKLLNSMPHEPNTFGWGSSPWEVHYALTVKCLEG